MAATPWVAEPKIPEVENMGKSFIPNQNAANNVVARNGSGAPILPKLLLVEDSKLDVMLVRNLVKNRYQLFSAANSAEAMRILVSEKDISLILMDVALPGSKSGVDLAADLRHSPEFGHIPVIGLSAQYERDVWTGYFADYVQKPYDKAVLTAKIDKYAIPFTTTNE